MAHRRSRLAALSSLTLLAMLVPADSFGQQAGDAKPPASPPQTPVARTPDARAKYRMRSPYQTLAPSLRAPAAPRAGPRAELAAPPPLPRAVCAPAPPTEPPVVIKRASNALPYRPFPATWQATLDSFTSEGHVPGAVIVVKSPDWGVRVGVTGKSNLATDAPMAPGMQFRVGSVSKMFVAQAILRLEQDGKIRLSDPVTAYLGDNPLVAGIPNVAHITVSELLQMTSGVVNYLEAPEIGWSPQLTPHKQFAPSDLIAVLSAAGPHRPGLPLAPNYAPGFTYPNPYWWTVLNPKWGTVPLPAPPPPEPPPYPAWSYSNSNYILLGLIAEKVTGLRAEAVIQRYVLDPIGLGDTYFAIDDRHIPAMHGYTKYGSIPYPDLVYATWCDVTATNPSYAWTAGAIVSTPWDLLKFSETIFTTNKILDAGTKNKWFTFVSADIQPGWEPMQYGVGGLMQPERSYGTARGHGGAIPGYHTLVYYFPEQNTQFVLATNTWDESWEAAMLDEIMPQVSSAVTTPRPAAGAVAQRSKNGTAHVAWQPGRIYGASYNVYSGPDADKVDRASAAAHEGVELQSVSRLEADVKAESGTTYWRVDTVAPGQALPLVIGPVWHFESH